MLKYIISLLIFLITFSNIKAEDPYEIFENYLNLRKEKIRKDSIQTLKFTLLETATNPTTNQTQTVTLKYWYKKDSLYRAEQEAMGQKLKIGYDGTTLWWTNPQSGGKLEKVQKDYHDFVMIQLIRENIQGGDLANFSRDSVKFEYIDKVTIDEKECHKIKQVDENNKESVFYYFDALTGLLYQLEAKIEQGTYYRKVKQYTKSGGFFFPLKVEEWLNDKKIKDKTYQTISINTKIDDRFFAMPTE